MQQQFNPKLILFFVLLAVAELYTIGAYGSIEASHGHPHRDFRDNARGLILLVSVAGLFLLPSRHHEFAIPKLPKLLSISLGFLLVWGLITILNAKEDQRLFEFIYRPSKNIFWEWGPGSTTATTSRGFIAELAIMIVFVLMIAKSTQSSAWKGILASFVICGVIVTFVGIGHKMLGAQHIYGIERVGSLESVELPKYYFAPFVYK